jgi:predicted DNA-binding protein with PD1-like motif
MPTVVHLHVEYDGQNGSTLGGWLCRDCGKWSMDIYDLPGTMTTGGAMRKGYVVCTVDVHHIAECYAYGHRESKGED